MVQLLWKMVGQLLKKLKIELLLPYDAPIELLDMDPKEQKAGTYSICTTVFIVASLS